MAEILEKRLPTSTVEEISAGMRTMTVTEIPPEILQTIFMYVSQQDRLNLRLSCKYFGEQASVPGVLQLDLSDRTFLPSEFSNLTKSLGQLMPNVVSLKLNGYNSEFIDEQFLVLLKENCFRLRNLVLENLEVTKGSTFKDLPDTLSELKISGVEFKSPDSFFDTQGAKYLSMIELRMDSGCNVGSLATLKGISAFTNLEVLQMDAVPNLVDESFVQLDGQLPNLVELQLTNLDIGEQSLRTIAKSFPKLTELTLSLCARVHDDGFATLKNKVLLEKLIIEDCYLTDVSVKIVLDRLLNLKHLSLRECGIEDRSMTSICQGLPHLEFLDIYTSVPKITDNGIRNVIDHRQLKDLSMVGVTLSDSGITLLVPGITNLTRLYVLSCGISDAGFETIADNLHVLETLILNDTIITNDGLARHLPKLTGLQHLEIDSVNFSEDGLLPIVNFLKGIPMIDIMFLQNDGGLHAHRMPPYSELKFKKFTTPAFITRILPAFPDAKTISLMDIKLTVADVAIIQDVHPNLDLLYMYDACTTDDVAIAILSGFSMLRELHIYGTHLTDATFLKLDRPDERALCKLSLESDHFPSEDTLVLVAPILCSMNGFDICTADMTNQICFKGGRGRINEITFVGPHVSDSVLMAIVPHLKDLNHLTLRRTSISIAGFCRLAPLLTKLEVLCLDLSTSPLTGDGAASVIGELVTRKLKVLSIEGESLTDKGLPMLGHHFDTLKRLQIVRSSITLDGIKAMSSRLGKIGNVVFRGHLHLVNAVAGNGIQFSEHDDDDDDEEEEV